jgi:hypothetical protein
MDVGVGMGVGASSGARATRCCCRCCCRCDDHVASCDIGHSLWPACFVAYAIDPRVAVLLERLVGGKPQAAENAVGVVELHVNAKASFVAEPSVAHVAIPVVLRVQLRCVLCLCLCLCLFVCVCVCVSE